MPYQEKDPMQTAIGAKVRWGKTAISQGVQTLLREDPVAAMGLNTIIRLHQNGQWGNVSAEDGQANEQALIDGGEIVSRYQLQGRTVLVVTGAEPRETTTVLFPQEYDASGGE